MAPVFYSPNHYAFYPNVSVNSGHGQKHVSEIIPSGISPRAFPMKTVRARLSSRRGAILSMELVLVLPLFLLLVFSIVEFSMLMSAQTRVSTACQSAARLMSLTGASTEEVESKVLSLLGPKLAQGCHVQVQPATHPGEVGYVSVQVPMKNASPDLLWMTGYGLGGRSLNASTPMVMERCAQAEIDRQLN